MLDRNLVGTMIVSRAVIPGMIARQKGAVHSQFLAAGLADELHLAVAPFFVGDRRASIIRQEARL